jgi:hypothetical protein
MLVATVSPPVVYSQQDAANIANSRIAKALVLIAKSGVEMNIQDLAFKLNDEEILDSERWHWTGPLFAPQPYRFVSSIDLRSSPLHISNLRFEINFNNSSGHPVIFQFLAVTMRPGSCLSPSDFDRSTEAKMVRQPSISPSVQAAPLWGALVPLNQGYIGSTASLIMQPDGCEVTIGREHAF